MQPKKTMSMKVSVLSKCANKGLYDGHTHDSKVLLEIRLGDYNILAKILYKNISFIYNLGISSLLKEELLRDIRTIRTILEKSEKEVKK